VKPEKDITDSKVIKALAHPMRIRILATLDQRVASPSELSTELGAPIGNVSYHVRMLESLGLIRLVRTTPKRGAIEHHYEAVARPKISDETWARVPESVKNAIIGAALEQAGRQVTLAAAAGGFDRPEARLARAPLALDADGWNAVAEELLATREQALKIAQAAEARLKENGEKGDSAVFLVMLFDPRGVPEQPPARRAPRRRKRRSTARA
jgi:DNA-binding transcriptional ArsR family regulator